MRTNRAADPRFVVVAVLLPLLSFQNEVYKYPDLWVCPYVRYGCDTWELEASCVDSAWMTEGGTPDAVFYPRLKLENPWEETIQERRIEAIADDTGVDSEGNEKNVSRTSKPPLLPPENRVEFLAVFVGVTFVSP